MLLDRYISARLSKRAKGDRSRFTAFLKTISWRIVGTVDTIVIAYFLTGTLDIAIQIGGIEVISKMILYYCHERVWDRYTKRA